MCRNPLNELRVPGLIQELALDGVPKAAELPAPLPPPEKGRPGGCGDRTGAQQVALRPGDLPAALRPGALPAALRHRARSRSPLPSARAAHPARLCAHRTLCPGFVSISGPGPRTGPPRHSGRHGAPRGSGPRLGEGRQDGPEAPPRGGRGRTPGSYAREPARSTLRPLALLREALQLLQLQQVHPPRRGRGCYETLSGDRGSDAAATQWDSEVTLEANPTSAPSSRLAAFRAAGVNRLSIGLQSLDDTELQLLGRTHSASEALQMLAEARRHFPGRVSVDLMLGLPAQHVGPWLGQLRKLLRLCDDHVSLYQLSLERGTALFTQVQQGALPAPDPELAAEMYQEGRAVLREAGFRQYEVSNFARNGALSTHNWTYWQCGQYLGVGPGAHGRFIPQGAGGHTREARIQTLEPDSWMKEVTLFGHGTRRRVPLGELALLEEVLAMGLRTDVGITHQHWQQFEPQLTLWDLFVADEEVQELLEQGLLLLDHRGLRCSWEGLAVLDSMLPTLLSRLQEAWQQRTPSPVQGG
ncbi:radical S-adenosyl methionine domain-containing protein 1, mitochondrial isoform 1-T3 [Megaptera novaeangliae]